MKIIEYRDDVYLRDGLGLLTTCGAILMGRNMYEANARMWANRPASLGRPAQPHDEVCLLAEAGNGGLEQHHRASRRCGGRSEKTQTAEKALTSSYGVMANSWRRC